MDLLHSAYSNDSDDEDGEEHKKNFVKHPPFKRLKPPNPNFPFKTKPPPPTHHHQHHHPNYHSRNPPPPPPPKPKEPMIPGRYVSKRERANSAAATSATASNSVSPSTVITSPTVVGSISDSDIRHDILSCLRFQAKGLTQHGKIPERLSVALSGHTKAVNTLQWSPTNAHLLASAGMDHTVCVWNVWSKEGHRKARVFDYHNAAIKDVKWSQQGFSLLSCGYDCSSRLIDVEMGMQTQVFNEDQIVGVIKFHPNNSNLFLSGGSKGFLRLWDIRLGKVVQEYVRSLGPILDIDFSVDAKHFISSSDISKSNVSENSIIVWDVSRQVPLSNQVYVEAYTCPCIKYHPFDPIFVAQSNGNYIAIFSSSPPFRLDKYKRYEKHGVSGFPIKCSFSLDGERLVSGSSDGCIYIYNYRSSELIRKIKAYKAACVDVAFHPGIPNVIASCSWMGDVSVFE